MARMWSEERQYIEYMLGQNASISSIAAKIGFSRQAVVQEIKKHRLPEDVILNVRDPHQLYYMHWYRNCRCSDLAGYLEFTTCERLQACPYCCNGCDLLKQCTACKIVYNARFANVQHTQEMCTSRRKRKTDTEVIQRVQHVLKAEAGTAISQIYRIHAQELGISETTFYRLYWDEIYKETW